MLFTTLIYSREQPGLLENGCRSAFKTQSQSKIELFAKIAMFDVWLGTEYAWIRDDWFKEKEEEEEAFQKIL